MSNHEQLSLFSRISGANTMLDCTERDVAVANPEAYNFRLGLSRRLAATWRERAADNIKAIRLSNRIQTEDRQATEAEKRQLIRFVGFGAMPKLFPIKGEAFPKGWEDIGKSLNSAVTKEEWAALAKATQYAHYTPEYIVRSMWKGIKRLGFTGGRVLEPGCGTGLFLAMMPEGMASRSSFLGIENDPTTARIASLLYPEADIVREDFTRAILPAGLDLAIGNPPFNDRTVHGVDGHPELSLHDFFIARSIERLRPGAIAAFVTSRYTMDKVNTKARQHISTMADLVGAIRLPEASMRADAGTDVVVDLLFFQRRENAPEQDPAWVETGDSGFKRDGKPIWINQYFTLFPDMVLGEAALVSTPFGPDYGVKQRKNDPLDIALAGAIKKLPEGIYRQGAPIHGTAEEQARDVRPSVRIGTAKEGALIREGSYFVQGDVLFQVISGTPIKVQIRAKGADGKFTSGIFEKHARIIRDLVAVRDAVREVLRLQSADEPYAMAQAMLGRVYDAFVAEHGPINKTVVTEREVKDKNGIPQLDDNGNILMRETHRLPNLSPFDDDPDAYLVASIETYDISSDTAKRGAIFTRNVSPRSASLVIESPADALAVALNETGKVDLTRIAELLTQARQAKEPEAHALTEVDAASELGDLIYEAPGSDLSVPGEWQTKDEYLSGRVRDKLEAAKAAAEADKRFERNVTALELVQPVDLPPSEITMRLGSPLLPASDVMRFCSEVIGIDTTVTFTASVNLWVVDPEPFKGRAAAVTDWGTKRRHAGDLLVNALTQAQPIVYDEIEFPDGTKTRVLNEKETQAARDKLQKIEEAFDAWVWTDAVRTERLCADYNRVMNNLVGREFDGDHLVLPGASSVIELRKHQKRAIWRMINGSTYLAHVVGAGKTFAMIAGAMEQKRLGIIQKPLVVVPSHTLAQWAREWMLLYPIASILVADEDKFEKSKRQRFLARATTGDWDAIIITTDAFKMIPLPADFEQGMIQEQIDMYERLLEELDEDETLTRKKLEKAKEKLEEKYEKLSDTKHDDMVNLAQMDIDHIIVDEAQNFRKLTFQTTQTTLKGVDPNGSQAAWHLYVASRYIKEKKNSRHHMTMASGTPITNTMGEAFSLIRFMDEEALEDHRVAHFDAWTAMFARPKTELELQVSGKYKPVTRLRTFVNLPELSSMFRKFADVVSGDDLREYVNLPVIAMNDSGVRARQVLTYEPSDAFKDYQKLLDIRLDAIKARGKPGPGDDIILTVIGDGRHAAIDMRLVDTEGDSELPGLDPERLGKLRYLEEAEHNDNGNKLNGMIANVARIWRETSSNEYVDPITGDPDFLTGATQMVFSDLGVNPRRGFHGYAWIKSQLIAKGVPADQIAIMQEHKRPSAKQRIFNAMNSGRLRVLIGSSEAMGTGVNAQKRLIALHHLDVPWFPAWIGQREGRIERQGNQNREIQIYAYATLGSMDATMWQINEGKQRFIEAFLKGDKSVRSLEDVGESEVTNFAMAKALASGDTRLMTKAGLEGDIAKLRRQRVAFYESQMNVTRQIKAASDEIMKNTQKLTHVKEDLEQRRLPADDAWEIEIQGVTYTDKDEAFSVLGKSINKLNETDKREGTWVFARYAGFPIEADGHKHKTLNGDRYDLKLDIRFNNMRWNRVYAQDIRDPRALFERIEKRIVGLEGELKFTEDAIEAAEKRIADYSGRENAVFQHEDILRHKERELAELNEELAADDEEEHEVPKMAA